MPPSTPEQEIDRIAGSIAQYEPGAPAVSVAGSEYAPLESLLVRGDQFMADAPQPTKWLVEHLIRAGTLLVVAGGAKVFKSFTMCHLLLALISGKKVFGEFNVPKPCNVLLVQYEVAHSSLHARLSHLAAGLGIDPQDLRRLMLITPRQGMKGSMPCFDDPSWIGELMEIIHTNDIALTIIDPLRRATRLDENCNTEMSVFLGNLLNVRDQSNTTIVLIHHTSKEGRRESTPNSVRGASVFFDLPDGLIMIERPDMHSTQINVSTIHRDGGEPAPFSLSLNEDSEGSRFSVRYMGDLTQLSRQKQRRAMGTAFVNALKSVGGEATRQGLLAGGLSDYAFRQGRVVCLQDQTVVELQRRGRGGGKVYCLRGTLAANQNMGRKPDQGQGQGGAP